MKRTTRPAVTKASARLISGSSADSRPRRQRPARRAHARGLRARCRHQQAERALVGAARRHLADDAAGEHHQDAVGERAGSRRARPRPAARRCPGRARFDQLAMDELDGADVDAARRLADQQHLGVARHLAREHDLLLVAAGEVRRAQAGRRAAACRSAPSGWRNARRPLDRPAGSCGRRARAPDSRGSRSPRPRRPPTRPWRWRSSGTWARPRSRISAGSLGWPAIDRPGRIPSGGRRSARGCRTAPRSSSVWPLPETPAMPTISPARRLKLTSSSSRTPRASTRPRCSASSSTLARLRGALSSAAAPGGRPSARPAPRGWSRRCCGRPPSRPGA